jgi:hypothetical protein
MKPELIEYLDKARDTVSQVEDIVSSHGYPDDIRTVMVRGLLSTIMEDHRSMLQLFKIEAIASARALARDIVQGMRYGLWINACATSEQIVRIKETDDWALNLPEIIKEIDAAYSADAFVTSLKNRWGSQVYKYSVSGVIRLGRWNIDPSVGLVHTDEEIRDVSTIATLCIVVLAAKFLDRQNYGEDCKQVEALAELGLSASHG